LTYWGVFLLLIQCFLGFPFILTKAEIIFVLRIVLLSLLVYIDEITEMKKRDGTTI